MEIVSFYTALSDSPRSIGIAERFFVGFYADRVYCDAFFFMISPKHEDAAICGSKSAESECFQKCGSCEAAEQFVGIVDNADTQRSNSQVL